MLNHLEALTVIIGICALLLSGLLGYLFSRTNHGLSKALSYQLFGEAAIIALTIVFAYAWTATHVVLPAPIQMMLRLSIFGIGSCTSLFLYKTLAKIVQEEE
jgi:hypothetical protein